MISFISCTEKLIKKPENLIAKKKMVDILYDLAVITAAKNTNSIVLIEKNIKTMPYIYSKYKIDSIQFAESDLYYASDPTIYEDLFTQVEKRLHKEKTTIESAMHKKPESDKKSNAGKNKK